MPSGEIVIKLTEDNGNRKKQNEAPAGGKKGTQLQRDRQKRDEFEDFSSNPVSSNASQIKEGGSAHSALGAYAFTQCANLANDLIRSSFNFYQRNVGNITGDAQSVYNAEMVGVGLNVISKVASIGTSALGGFVVGGPAGAIVGGGVATVKAGVDFAEKAFQFNLQVSKDNRDVAFIKQRAGGETTNWSR